MISLYRSTRQFCYQTIKFSTKMPPKRKQPTKETVSDNESDDNSPKKTKTEDFSSNAKTPGGKKWNIKIVSWNVDGLRAALKKGALSLFSLESPDVICLQEIKCSKSKLPKEIKEVKGYEAYFNPSEKEGYSGVALFSKIEPLSVSYDYDEEFGNDGRFITAEFDKYYVVTAYVPNAGKKLCRLDARLEWDPKFKSYIQQLDEKKPVILCGDLNVSHKEIDLKNPKNNKKSAGFSQEERDGFTDLLEAGFVDAYRHFYPDKKDQFTFWTYMMNCRAKNVGWRLDYFVVSERIVPNLCDNLMRKTVLGSDHCPITLLMNM